MNTVLVGSEAVDLLSRITGQKLSQRDLTPSVIFLAALITVLLGVTLADNTVTDEEKQRWQKTINRFIPPDSNVRQLTQLMSKGVRQNQLYTKLDHLITLTNLLSEPEKLLLIGFGYEMSAADGEMDSREKKYLEAVANRLGINPQYLAVLEAGFSHQGTIEPTILTEVQSLLDPARFQSLDTVFVKAASDMLAALPAKPEHKVTQHHLTLSYGKLEKFQEYRKQLDTLCHQLFQLIQDCNNRDVLSYTLAEEVGNVSHKLQSERFRVAVVGEFSQGKSTLLNALLGEKIQPVRAIPCSGTVTVLRYGTQRLIICRYKNGKQETIPFEQYQVKAAIPKDAALDCYSEHLASSDIDEIIFENPDWELCRNDVEIIDSPGLNEHPDRTAITQKLLKNTDAVIFLANASRPLTKWEQDYLTNDLRSQLTSGKDNEPADNLFILVNFIDLLDEKDDRQDVVQRFESFVKGKTPLIKGENRIHFVSAKAALKAIFDDSKDEYLKSFQDFTHSIEKFLTTERGFLKIKRSVTELNGLIKLSLDGLHQAEDTLNGKLKLSEAERQKILEQIGEASGRDIRIRQFADQFIDQVIEQSNKSWNEWLEGLEGRLVEKAAEWSSNHSAIWSRKELANEYACQFNINLSSELESWINNQLKQTVLKQPLEVLDGTIKQELQTIQLKFQNLSYLSSNESLNMTFVRESQADFNSNATKGFWGSLGAVGVGAALLPVAFLAGPILFVIASLSAGLVGGGGIAAFEETIKENILQMGCEQFVNSMDDVFENIDKIIVSVFDDRVNAASEIIKKTISFYENLLVQQEKAHKETLEQREIEKAWIAQKRQELEQVQNNIEAIMNQCGG
jgi:uncharacterized tellurite resistance protein B-like protein/GTPase SAR1 family protein